MAATVFHPAREAALTALAGFVPRAGKAYAHGRNTDPGPEGVHAVSKLSPYLRHRLLLESEVIAATLRVHSLDASEKFLQEVFWRAYFKGWLEHHPGVWADYVTGRDAALTDAEQNSGLGAALARAEAGQTGIACFDSWVAELVETGYLHNHARMWFASIWTFTLGLPWQLGADFFLRYLVDGDPASNTLSWRWVAGLHTRGKHYVARADNIARFTNGRFNPVGELNESPDPLTEETLPTPRPMDLADVCPADTGPAGPEALLLTDDDLCRDEIAEPTRVQVMGFADLAALRSSRAISPLVQGFTAGAITDRAAAVGDIGADRAQCFSAAPSGLPELMDTVMAWLTGHEARTLRMAWPVQGPAREFATALAPHLTARGIRLTFGLRTYDRLAWPHAQKGFFKLKTRIPDLIRMQSLGA